MSTVKISDLTEITSAAVGDYLPILDVSDTSQADTGSTRKVKYSNIISNSQTLSPTGSADNVQIQAALTTLSSTGGELFCKAGTYDIQDTILIPSNIIIRGEGIKTLFQVNATVNGLKNIFQNADSTNGNTNIIIRNCAIDGNQANRSGKVNGQDSKGANVIYINSSFCTVENVISYNGAQSCIALNGNTFECLITKCQIYNSWDHNILISSGKQDGTVTCKRNIISNNVVYGAGNGNTQGVGIEIANFSCENIITGNVSRNNLEGGIHCYYQSNRNVISNNVSYANGQNGIAIVDKSDFNNITNNIIKDCSQAGVNCTISSLTYGGKNLIIKGNTIINCGWNGIRGTTSGDLSNSIIEGNTISDCGAGGLANEQTSFYSNAMVDTSIMNNTFINSYERTIRLDSPARCTISHNYMTGGGIIGGFSNHALFIDTGTSINDISIIGNTIESNNGAGILIGHNAFRLLIHGNIIKSMNGNNSGMDLRGVQRSSISGNACTSNTSIGIVLRQDASAVQCTHNTINGNICTSNTSGGIVEQNNSNFNIYIANDCNGNTTNNFATVGANDVIANNITT